jgi:DNA replication protein DnaC
MSGAAQVIPSGKSSCPLCRGTGWKMVPGEDGGALQAVRCDCERELRLRRLLEMASIPPRYYHCTIEDFDPEPYAGAPEALRHARMIAQSFADNYPAETLGLLIIGPCGVGKTHLAVAIIRKLMERGIGCKFAEYRELLKDIQRTWDPNNPQSEAAVVDPLLKAEVLVLDDLGVGRATEWSLETLHYLLNHRYTHERTTILTTNLEDGEVRTQRLADGSTYEAGRVLVQAIGERLRSRLYEMCRPVALGGDDFRKRIRSH